MQVKCTVHSSYENKILTTISRIHLFLASNVTLWELHSAVTALPRSRTVTVECLSYGNVGITLTPCFGPAEWFWYDGFPIRWR